MTTRLVRAELRKLTTTKLPFAFLFVLAIISTITAVAVVFGTDADGSKGFISTAADQRSLMAFATNAMPIAGLFGAIAVAREYGHGTVVPTFLAAPRRHHAVLAQYVAVLVAGAAVGLVGAGLTIVGVAAALPTTEYGFLPSVRTVGVILAASTFGGAVGAVLGAGVGSVVRNTGGAVTAVFLLLVVAPPLVVQLASDASSWMPATLTSVLSGVTHEISRPVAVFALGLWAAVPAAIGVLAVGRRDVV